MARLSLSFSATSPPAFFANDLLILVTQLHVPRQCSVLLDNAVTLQLGLVGVVRINSSARDLFHSGSASTSRVFLDHVEDAVSALALWRGDAATSDMLAGGHDGTYDTVMRMSVPKKLPASIETSSFSISYSLTLALTRRPALSTEPQQIICRSTIPFDILPSFSPKLPPILPTLRACAFTAKVEMPTTRFTPSQRVPVTLTVDRQSNSEALHVRTSLIKRVYTRDAAHGISSSDPLDAKEAAWAAHCRSEEELVLPLIVCDRANEDLTLAQISQTLYLPATAASLTALLPLPTAATSTALCLAPFTSHLQAWFASVESTLAARYTHVCQRYYVRLAISPKPIWRLPESSETAKAGHWHDNELLIPISIGSVVESRRGHEGDVEGCVLPPPTFNEALKVVPAYW